MAYEKADPEVWEKKDRAIIAECAVKFIPDDFKIKVLADNHFEGKDMDKIFSGLADWAYGYIIEKREGYDVKTLTYGEKVKLYKKLVAEIKEEKDFKKQTQF